MEYQLKFENYWEVLALHKSMMAVKFDPSAYLKEAQGSPFTASIAIKVFDLLVSMSLNDGKVQRAKDWQQWQIADESRTETQLLITRIGEQGWWLEASHEKRKEYIVNFMSPLKLSDSFIDTLVVGS